MNKELTRLHDMITRLSTEVWTQMYTTSVYCQEDHTLDDINSQAFNRTQVTQNLVDFAECRTLIRALLNSADEVDVTSIAISDIARRLDTNKDELQILSEEIFKARAAQKHQAKEIEQLNNQIQIVDKNQASLHLTLTKLRAKQETHRARAAGAEHELKHAHQCSDETRSSIQERVRMAKASVEQVLADRDTGGRVLFELQDSILSEIESLNGISRRMSSFLDHNKRIKYTSA